MITSTSKIFLLFFACSILSVAPRLREKEENCQRQKNKTLRLEKMNQDADAKIDSFKCLVRRNIELLKK